MHVLFVDDDGLLAEGVEKALHKQGHTCQIAGLGEQAIMLARDNAYDIIVLDVALPDMGGFEVIRRMKWEGIKTPVLLESGLSAPDLASLGAALGVDEFLVKPFSINELIARMETVIASSGEGGLDPGPGTSLEAILNGLAEPSEPNPAQTLKQNHAERRQHERTPMFGAALITEEGRHISCVVLDVSDGGAALKLSEPDQQCPTLFTLQPLDGPARRCEVRWRKGALLGVEFA